MTSATPELVETGFDPLDGGAICAALASIDKLWSWVSGVRVPSLTPSFVAGDLRV
jgi:hypothetical protein